MKSINLALWSVNLILQLGLIAVLFRRQIARRAPLFTLLIAFYVVRSVLMYVLSTHMAHATYYNLYQDFALADTVLQILVAIEIAVTALRSGQWSGQRTVAQALLLMAGVLAAMFLAALLPSRGRVPIDRGTVFASALMILLFIWMAAAGVRGHARRIVEGFAFYGAVAILANVERNQAALHRNARWYVAGSYVQSAAYMLALVFWILTIKPEPSRKLNKRRATAKA